MEKTEAHNAKPSLSKIDTNEITNTLLRLHARIVSRFPGAGLGNVCEELIRVSREADERAILLAKPFWSLRIGAVSLGALLLLGAITFFKGRATDVEGLHFAEFVQMLEAATNELVMVGAGVFFLFSLENRARRRRALAALHELRSIAHIVDMHQLTKDPEALLFPAGANQVSPARVLSRHELGRYLDYCSELLSLVSKLAVCYVQRVDDSVTISTSTEIEDLTNGLSRKIWQKIMILHSAAHPDSEDSSLAERVRLGQPQAS